MYFPRFEASNLRVSHYIPTDGKGATAQASYLNWQNTSIFPLNWENTSILPVERCYIPALLCYYPGKKMRYVGE